MTTVVFEISLWETTTPEQHPYEARLTVEWPDKRHLPCSGDIIYFDKLVFRVHSVIHAIGSQYFPDTLIRVDMSGRVASADAWFLDVSQNLDTFGEPGMCKEITKQW